MKTKQNLWIMSMLLAFTFACTACGNNAVAPSSSTPESSVTESSVTESSVTESSVTESSVTESSVPESNVPESSVSESAEPAPELRPALSDKRIKITINDTDVVYATLADSHATEIFTENLPFTIEMDDYINRNKRGPLPFSIAEEDQQNIIYPFELGDIIYYPPTQLLGIFYDHNGAEISAGYELVAQMDDEGIEAFKQLPTDVDVTVMVELSE